MKYSKLFLFTLFLSIARLASAHPIGNIITVDNHILWSYVSPAGDIEHHACIMIWDQKSDPRPFLVSEHSASDYVLFVKRKTIYIIESRYVNTSDSFESRILKTNIDGESKVIWPWFKDKWKIGSNGFFMNSDTQIIFGNYPNIYCLDRGSEAEVHFKSDYAINKIKPIDEDKILLLSDNHCWLTNIDGKVLKIWKNLTEPKIHDAPLDRNTIYDADYYDDQLLFAYWGKRTFELINKNNIRQVLKQCEANWVPHWVSFLGNSPLLFSSNLDFENPFTKDGLKSTITPDFEFYKNGNFTKIWHMYTTD